MSTIDLAAAPSDLRALAEQSNAWPFEQAKAIVARLKKKPKDEVLFETGYGPSGLPHIGTFGEVARTTMVRYAFRVLTEDKIKTRLLAFWINGTDSGDCCAFSGGPFVESRYFGEGIGIAVRKGNDLLRQSLNWALFRLWEKGRYTDLWLRYFSVSPF